MSLLFVLALASVATAGELDHDINPAPCNIDIVAVVPSPSRLAIAVERSAAPVAPLGLLAPCSMGLVGDFFPQLVRLFFSSLEMLKISTAQKRRNNLPWHAVSQTRMRFGRRLDWELCHAGLPYPSSDHRP